MAAVTTASGRGRPARVTVALVALAAAVALSAAALVANQFFFHGAGIGPGLGLGLLTLIIQAGMLVLIARGEWVGRALAVIFLVLAATTLPMVPRLLAERTLYSAGYLVFGFLLKAIGVVLLFTGESRRWFAVRT